ncbi:hypothetical protein F4780DRAFT_660154 [Xylariomycetidae sp. FL0641]|nr:hypothetical protein F4780DRAFT_660154 [Xylariomycetidae sp. FL0641]
MPAGSPASLKSRRQRAGLVGVVGSVCGAVEVDSIQSEAKAMVASASSRIISSMVATSGSRSHITVTTSMSNFAGCRCHCSSVGWRSDGGVVAADVVVQGGRAVVGDAKTFRLSMLTTSYNLKLQGSNPANTPVFRACFRVVWSRQQLPRHPPSPRLWGFHKEPGRD